MPKVPNATTFATATAVSRGDALIAGLNAVIAVTPHIEVPAAIRAPIFCGIPSALATLVVTRRPIPTDAATHGTPYAPRLAISKKDNLNPTHMIPALKSVVEHVLNPGTRLDGNVVRLFNASPTRIATGIPDTTEAVEPSNPCIASNPFDTTSALRNPNVDTPAAAAIPGTTLVVVVVTFDSSLSEVENNTLIVSCFL